MFRSEVYICVTLVKTHLKWHCTDTVERKFGVWEQILSDGKQSWKEEDITGTRSNLTHIHTRTNTQVIDGLSVCVTYKDSHTVITMSRYIGTAKEICSETDLKKDLSNLASVAGTSIAVSR